MVHLDINFEEILKSFDRSEFVDGINFMEALNLHFSIEIEKILHETWKKGEPQEGDRFNTLMHWANELFQANLISAKVFALIANSLTCEYAWE